VLEVAEAEIALATEQAAHLAGVVAMIDAQGFFRPLATDGASAALSRQHRLVVVD
jgi:hypothetical protein